MMTTHFLAPQKISICRKDGALWLKMDGQKVKLDAPKRAMPLSSPDEFIVLSDHESHEIGVIRHLSDLEPGSRDVLRGALESAYQVTQVTRLLDVERDPLSGQVRWRVEVKTEADEDNDAVHLVRSIPAWRLGRPKRDKTEGDEEQPFFRTEKTFSIAGNEDVQTARYPRIFITDVEGNRYEIENCEELDLTSRRLGEKYF